MALKVDSIYLSRENLGKGMRWKGLMNEMKWSHNCWLLNWDKTLSARKPQKELPFTTQTRIIFISISLIKREILWNIHLRRKCQKVDGMNDLDWNFMHNSPSKCISTWLLFVFFMHSFMITGTVWTHIYIHIQHTENYDMCLICKSQQLCDMKNEKKKIEWEKCDDFLCFWHLYSHDITSRYVMDFIFFCDSYKLCIIFCRFN